MARPRVSQKTIDAIENVWGRDPTLTAKEVHDRVKALPETKAESVSVRKVQQLVAGWKKNGGGRVELQVWQPWTNVEETSDDTEFLLAVQRHTTRIFGPASVRSRGRLGPAPSVSHLQRPSMASGPNNPAIYRTGDHSGEPKESHFYWRSGRHADVSAMVAPR